MTFPFPSGRFTTTRNRSTGSTGTPLCPKTCVLGYWRHPFEHPRNGIATPFGQSIPVNPSTRPHWHLDYIKDALHPIEQSRQGAPFRWVVDNQTGQSDNNNVSDNHSMVQGKC